MNVSIYRQAPTSIALSRYRAGDTLQNTRPEPIAGPGQTIVAPRLVSLIIRDVQILRGRYGPRQLPERIPMSESVGEVIAVGEGVSQVKPAELVLCLGTGGVALAEFLFKPSRPMELQR
ncbi:hypothetical protein ABNM12_00055 [Pseudomonas syringae]|uniref:Alcohol dehydrogenase-like N-terminal domain-containing protein n=3 Tax=Pseudomonas TaxID=286 RepID=Q4ZT83_PSEU2|nr:MULTISPECIES: hypothetical protein [Pseudomonas]AAY37639.1 hypothetical protein Psyr_2600 [Pseudomonas syringae pv. syringae B728a]EXL30690.1 MDR family alcohol dehydrogenase [Pseudomonas syringae pv. syringae str. B301D-R]KWS17641.1 hypothetical protein AL064_02730 [Pseudomonas syringae pv. syringae]KWS28489.1 hypothetical protein AL062_05345 [Pseudomonas syringae pv. syringae]MCH5512655.1 hypothetical protein [Pseudomonas syringae pv. syringae]